MLNIIETMLTNAFMFIGNIFANAASLACPLIWLDEPVAPKSIIEK